ncbi:hypothetical protein EX30DRAFT_378428 [Ascodesmis nigricans]|uniref:Secreted protein n=1 Tax=Ascodesmis nigricans TaxID=341454 RepID=A0A4S2MVR6_9PEZI|nr:hypothetical protein EX30DRAFT_378428 [Ascodesmis nigricans]
MVFSAPLRTLGLMHWVSMAIGVTSVTIEATQTILHPIASRRLDSPLQRVHHFSRHSTTTQTPDFQCSLRRREQSLLLHISKTVISRYLPPQTLTVVRCISSALKITPLSRCSRM